MPKVNQQILIWAREAAGLSIEEAAEKLSLKAERISSFEKGTESPSRPMLVRMSKQYRRPLLAFYMSEPPRKGDRGEDFRMLPDQQAGPLNILVDTLVRDVRARQGMVRSLLEDAGEATELAFIGSKNLASGIDAVSRSISETIGVSTDQFQHATGAEEGFALLRSGTEAAGIFVMLAGNLGSHHTAIDVEVFRGFAIADKVAPFVVVNDQDAKTAWAFTLVHELAHLWLGATGISGMYADSQLEQFCNLVASHYLLPSRQLKELKIERTINLETAQERIRDFSTQHNVSASMIAYRLFLSEAISLEMWHQLRKNFRELWRASRDRARADAREQEGGPSYYVVRRHRVGNALIQLAKRTMSEGLLTPTKAAKILGVKPMNVYELIHSSAPSA